VVFDAKKAVKGMPKEPSGEEGGDKKEEKP